MKKSLLLTLIAIVAILPDINAQSARAWEIDASHSSIKFEINHFFTPVDGAFQEFEGTLNFDPADLKGSKADFTIQVASIDTDNEKRNNHLQSGDFFDAKKWPTIHFVSDSFEKKDDKNFVIHGKLTMRDVTKDIDLPFTVLGIQDHPRKSGQLMTGLRAQANLNRIDYGVGTGSWAATAVVGDDVNFTITLEATSKK